MWRLIAFLIVCFLSAMLLIGYLADKTTPLLPEPTNWDWQKWRTAFTVVLFWVCHKWFAKQMWQNLASPETVKTIQAEHPTLGNFTNLKYIGYFAVCKKQFSKQITRYLLKMCCLACLLWFFGWHIPQIQISNP